MICCPRIALEDSHTVSDIHLRRHCGDDLRLGSPASNSKPRSCPRAGVHRRRDSKIPSPHLSNIVRTGSKSLGRPSHPLTAAAYSARTPYACLWSQTLPREVSLSPSWPPIASSVCVCQLCVCVTQNFLTLI